VSPRFCVFGLSWHCMDLTRVTVRMTHGSLYMTWPNDGLTRGSMNDNWTYTTCDVEGD
jgi:hypothetical protein